MLSDMDALSFDGYTSYSDSSAPRTPSPRADITYTSPTQIYDDEANAGASSGYRGSLLQELYGQDEAYGKQQQQQQQQQQHSQLPPSSSHPTMPRRATFPYVRHDVPSYPTSSYDVYEEAYVVPSNGPSGPTAYYQPPHNPYLQQHQQSSPHHHPYGPPSSGMLPAPNMMGGMPGMPMGPYGHLQPPLPIQHTDDAASKETQYLRRRCFNCHTTEPPSWRRSTLNPGKIVCNKCGLYERTHLRPRPLRFDELRAGGKSRKNSLSNGSSGGNGKTSPKSPGKSLVKKEIIDVGLGRVRGNRRSSVSSSAGSGSDWDDNASIYSSANNSGFNSPAGMLGHQQLPSLSPNPPHLGLGLNSGYNSNSNDFPTSSNSPSPPLSSAGIRLPNAPLTDIAEYRSHSVNSNGDYTEYTEYDHHSNDTLNTKLGYSEPYNDSYSNSPYLNNHVHLSSSSSPSPLPRTPHSLPLPLSSTNSPYLGSSHLASPHLGSPGNMIPSPLAEAQQIQSQISAGSSSNGSTSTLMGISSDTSDSANGKGSPMMMPPSLTRDLLVPVGSGSSGQRNKSHTISTGSPYEAYLNASREVRGQEQRNPRMLYGAHRERSGSVSSAYSTNSAGSTQSSRSPSILHSARSVHASLPEDAGEGDLVVHVNGSMGKMHMGLGSSYELHEVARLSPCSNPMETLDPSVLDGERV